jgi:uncharacterized protein YndB with AHSA1/START domain
MTETTFTTKARVPAPVATVHRALTDPAALRVWLAEHAEVELPHRYEFWGRYTPEGDEPHQRLLHADEHSLRFSWLLAGEDTTVSIDLEPQDPNTTILSLSQTHFPGWEEAVKEDSVLGMLATFWTLMIANLVDHVEGREPVALVDFTSPQMRAQCLIGAAPAEVFDSLVNPAKFSRWFGANLEIETHPGGRFAMGGFELDPTPARILELEPDRKLSLGWPDGLVTDWELEGSAGNTRLTIVQSGFDRGKPPYGSWLGWLSGIAELRRFHELSGWRSMWLDVEMPGLPEGMLSLGQEA